MSMKLTLSKLGLLAGDRWGNGKLHQRLTLPVQPTPVQRIQASVQPWLDEAQELGADLKAAAAALWTPSEHQRQRLNGLKRAAPTSFIAAVANSSKPSNNYLASVQTIAAQTEEQYQQWLQRHFNHLFSATRQQQLQTLGLEQETLVISVEDRWLNRDIASLTCVVGLATASHLLYPPLIVPTLVVALASTVAQIKRAWKVSVAQRGLTVEALLAIFRVGTWLSGYFITGGLTSIGVRFVRKFIGQTRDQSRKQLVNIFGQQLHTVWVLIDGVEVERPLAELQTGDIVVVQAGQMIPVDGVITHGVAAVDQHRLTGEAQPVERGVGDPVLAATIVLSGRLLIRVEKTGGDTLAAQIGAILRKTTEHHLTLQTRGERIANQSVLPTVLISGVSLLTVGVNGALATLYTSPGLGMYMVGPLTLLNYLNLLARRHILVKDGRSLELLQTVDTVVFDKTGTLTLDQFHVQQIHLSAAYSAAEVLTYAAAAEQRQSHPLAKAIWAAAQEQKLTLPTVADAQYEVGYGLKVWLESATVHGMNSASQVTAQGAGTPLRDAKVLVRVGSERFMGMEGLALPPTLQAIYADGQAQGHSFVFVALDDEVVGAIELAPTVRPEAKAVVAALRQRGLQVLIISGDQAEPTRRLATALGIDDYYANVLPQQKAALVAQLHQQGRAVCFVGDGINDAIALKQAKVSVSLRGATSVATDTAQIVLMEQNLDQLPILFNLAHEMHHNLNANFLVTFVPTVMVVGGVFFAHAGIPLALLSNFFCMGVSVGIAMWPVYKQRGRLAEKESFHSDHSE